ncbi:MAG: hypothetical protein IKO79_03045 [Butyrivibrio sp.]|nr:hypothetical protein [Butyrivibrio sp.]
MSKIREAIKVLHNVIAYLEDYEEILKLNNCNTCRNKNCPYRPKWGEKVRINCPLYIKKVRDEKNAAKEVSENATTE